MPRATKGYERAALAAGMLTVDQDGHVYRIRRFGRACAPYLAERTRPDGYLAVPVALDGRRVRLLAHRIVYEAKVGPIPAGWLVRQRNGDRADNRPDNLLVTAPGSKPAKTAV